MLAFRTEGLAEDKFYHFLQGANEYKGMPKDNKARYLKIKTQISSKNIVYFWDNNYYICLPLDIKLEL